MVTDEMVKRAATEYLSHKGERPYRVTRRGAELWEDHAPAMRAALEAALSAAEPAAWVYAPDLAKGSGGFGKEKGSVLMSLDGEWINVDTPLYASPPAPSVAVKALRWKGPDSYGEYHSLDGLWGYIIRCEDDGHWLTEVGEYFRSPEAAKAAAQADYEDRIRSALSAQVQDESEIIDCLLAGKPFIFDPATNFCHANDGGAPEHGIKYVPAAQVQDVAGWQDISTLEPKDGMIVMGWGEYRERDGFSPAFMRWYDSVGGWSVSAMPFYPTHWMPLPAAPAKQEGGE